MVLTMALGSASLIIGLTRSEAFMPASITCIVVYDSSSTMLHLLQQYRVLSSLVSKTLIISSSHGSITSTRSIRVSQNTFFPRRINLTTWYLIGLLMNVYGYEIPQRVHNGLAMVSCDVPASRKARGISSFIGLVTVTRTTGLYGGVIRLP